MSSTHEVEFSTFDGTKLRGVLFLPDGDQPAPAVVMTAGFTFLKNHFIDQIAKLFQKAGIAALIYDHRNWGSSDGQPRQHTNFFEQAGDYADAITFLEQHKQVDANRIGIWGIGNSGGVVILAAAADKRVKATVIALPFISGVHDSKFWPKGHAAMIHEERKAGANRGRSKEPWYIPIFAESREDAEKDPFARLIGIPEAFDLYRRSKEMSDAAGVKWENKVTLQSLFYQRAWEPTVYLPQIEAPVLWVMAKSDEFTPIDVQKQAFDTIKSPKQLMESDSGNLQAILDPNVFERVVREQISWLRQTL